MEFQLSQHSITEKYFMTKQNSVKEKIPVKDIIQKCKTFSTSNLFLVIILNIP